MVSHPFDTKVMIPKESHAPISSLTIDVNSIALIFTRSLFYTNILSDPL